MELELIKKKIHTIRGMQVIFDRDLAKFYNVQTRRINEQVKRNHKRFPIDFCFKLTENEVNIMVSQNAIPSKKYLGGHLPIAFTEHGITMLSSVLKSDKAVEINILIIRAFIAMKKFISNNINIINRIDNLERKQIEYKIKTDNNFDKIFDLMQNNIPKQGIFFDGQIFDSYKFVCDLIKSAKNNIILIDNYIDETVLEIFTKTKVNIQIYSANYLSLDIDKYKKQYNNVEIIKFSKSHDRFLIIDDMVYHIGASLKDLGKKWFAFSKLDKDGLKILDNI
jgi:hypothetical protein